jgi:hypothetical protein
MAYSRSGLLIGFDVAWTNGKYRFYQKYKSYEDTFAGECFYDGTFTETSSKQLVGNQFADSLIINSINQSYNWDSVSLKEPSHIYPCDLHMVDETNSYGFTYGAGTCYTPYQVQIQVRDMKAGEATIETNWDKIGDYLGYFNDEYEGNKKKEVGLMVWLQLEANYTWDYWKCYGAGYCPEIYWYENYSPKFVYGIYYADTEKFYSKDYPYIHTISCGGKEYNTYYELAYIRVNAPVTIKKEVY